MELRQLEYFLKCAEKGSLTRAAEELYTTQPHVSQVIRALERELGVTLFRRTGAGIVLTEDGERIRFYAQNAVKNTALIKETAKDRSGTTLRIAANPSSRLAFLAGEYFSERMAEGMALQYTECGIEQMMELVQHRQYDLGFLFMPENKRIAFTHLAERRHLHFTTLLQSDLVLHCGPMSPFYGRDSVEPEELNECECIQMEDDFFSLEELLLEHPMYRSGKWSLKKLIRTNSDHLMLDMLRTTSLCNLGSYWLRNNGEGEAFSRSAVKGFENRITFGCLCIDNRPLSAPAEEFLWAIKAKL
ncbi:MAG: LysR family transcriptional regulator [Oscillospiraceae bacterium]|nr:LysR family transcriptional regulator [Oscillospiraceae bacterium]